MKKLIAALAVAGLALAGCGIPDSDPVALPISAGHGSAGAFLESYYYASNPGLTNFYLEVHEPVVSESSALYAYLNHYVPEGE